MTKPVLPQAVLDALGDRANARELHDAGEALSLLASALPVAAPSPAARARLLDAVASGAERFAPFFTRLCALVDLGAEQVRALFDRAEDAAAWRHKPELGLALFDIQGGAALAGADAGLIRLRAGTAFPEHRHLGRERVLVLEGSYRDASGTVYRAGDLHEMPTGSSHSYVVSSDGPCLFAVVLEGGGIEIDGQRVSV